MQRGGWEEGKEIREGKRNRRVWSEIGKRIQKSDKRRDMVVIKAFYMFKNRISHNIIAKIRLSSFGSPCLEESFKVKIQ